MKTIIANWKMSPDSLEEARDLLAVELAAARGCQNVKTIFCPPFVYIEELAKEIPLGSLGAQDISWAESGAFTGEISASMVKNLGVTYVLIGHSDRRYLLGETDGMINKKIKTALEAGITPVLLVGEKNKGDDRLSVLNSQLSADFDGLGKAELEKIIIAYEPVWAISTHEGAKPDVPADTLSAVRIIKKFLADRSAEATVIYGGSVNESNVALFLAHPEIGGAVIGGASLRGGEFSNILKIVSAL